MASSFVEEVFEKINSIYIEVSSQCNLACTHCFRTHHEYASKNKNMSFEVFKTIVDQLPFTKTYMLCPQGVGESILNKDFLKMLTYAKDSRKFHRIEIHSNLLAVEVEKYSQMFECGLTNLYLSVDSLDHRTLNQTRTGTHLEKLKDNVEAIVRQFGNRMALRVTLSTLNLNEISNLCQWYASIGGSIMQIAPLLSFGHDDSVQLSPELFLHVSNSFKFPDIKLRFINPWETNNTKECSVFEETMSFDALGRMTPCCVVVDSHTSHFGDIMKNTFTNLLKERNRFHERLYQERPAVYQRCYFYPKS